MGHLITTDGLKPNPSLTAAVTDYPTPRSAKEFVGLASYYRRFVANFARIAHPLHALTQNGASFEWTPECQEAFDLLKRKLTSAPILAYPNFNKGFVLETDASIHGLGSILSQEQSDGKLQPIAFTSQALSQPEKNYGISNSGCGMGL